MAETLSPPIEQTTPEHYDQFVPLSGRLGEGVKAIDSVTGNEKFFTDEEILADRVGSPQVPEGAPTPTSSPEATPIPVLDADARAERPAAPEVVVPLGPEATPPAAALEGEAALPPALAAPEVPPTPAEPETPAQPPVGEAPPPPPGAGEDATTEEDDAPADMAPERRRGFRALPERSRNVLQRMYDQVAAEPELRRVIGKMEIAYHQIFLDRHQEDSAKLKTKLDIVDAKLEGTDEARSDIEADIAQMERDGEPGSEALKMSLQKLDRRRAKIMAERDKKQTAFEAVDNKARLRATKRDAVADRLIDTYDKELLPLESELEALQTARDEVELTVIVTEVKHKELRQRAEEIQERKERTAGNMRRGGSSEKDIRKAMSSYDTRIYGIAEQISRDEGAIATRKLEIDARVAIVAAAADPYRDKREEFVRIKNSRPIDIKVEARTREVVTDEETPTIGRTREFAEPGGGAETTAAPEVDTDPRPEVSSYVSQWNEHLAAKGIDGARPVDLGKFTKDAGIGEATKLDSDDFKKILAAYLKAIKVSSEHADALGDFLAGA